MKTHKKYLMTEAKKITDVDTFVDAIDSTIRKIFPKSYINVKYSERLTKSIGISFTIGNGKSEYANGIINNDPAHHTFHIWLDKMVDGVLPPKVVTEIGTGGTLYVKDETGRMAFNTIKVGWRKKTGTPQQTVKHFDTYFKKLMKAFVDNKENLVQSHYELIGNKY